MDNNLQSGSLGIKITWLGALVNFVLIAIKFAAGILGRSQALIADAVHSISDFFTDVVVLIGLRAGRKAPDSDHHFGHARIETTAAAVIGLALILVAALLGHRAVTEILAGKERHPTWLALCGAGLSIVVKELLYQYTLRVGKKIKSPVVIANAWHHRSDAWSSVAVFLGVLGAIIVPDWYVLDSYAAILVSVFIMKVGISIFWGAMKEMTDTAPAPEVIENIVSCVRKVSGVLQEHDLKVRTSGGSYHIQVHVRVDQNLTVLEGHRIAREVQKCLRQDVDNTSEVIVHVDPADAKDLPV